MFTGVVLVGGSSRRMGRPKSLVVVEGAALVDRVGGVLATSCEVVYALGPSALSGGLPCIADQFPGEGPLGAVISALESIAASEPLAVGVVVAACDLVNLDSGTIDRLIGALLADPSLDVVMTRSTRVQPLCSVWRLSCAPQLRQRFDDGERSMMGGIADLNVGHVDVGEDVLVNVNTPDDLHRVGM